jgi:23S rRNA (adenine2503-C2)-methyltransferase
MNCSFCDVPKVGNGRNATYEDLIGQVALALAQPGMPQYTNRLNIHYARMGEPTWNFAVIDSAYEIARKLDNYRPHPVVSTMMPVKNKRLHEFVHDWMTVKNAIFEGNAGLQLSINSTDEAERQQMFSGNACTLAEIQSILQGFRPVGRKITLNFAVAGYTVDCELLAKMFSPDHFIVKLTPMHKTLAALENGIETSGNYTEPEPYQELELRFKKAGFETLVFIASRDEDEGRITCGNAILSGTLPHKFQEHTLGN